jgi:hypothetical protein
LVLDKTQLGVDLFDRDGEIGTCSGEKSVLMFFHKIDTTTKGFGKRGSCTRRQVNHAWMDIHASTPCCCLTYMS